jgi:hypothetical protein
MVGRKRGDFMRLADDGVGKNSTETKKIGILENGTFGVVDGGNLISC